MSSGGGGGGGVGGSIPGSVRRTIQDIKEIARGHTDDEVYAMLRDCNMDPNETAQRLLLQDTFHEVKRKRDKRKENPRESADTRWRGGMQGRGVRGGRGNYTSRYISSDAGGGRSANVGKENGDNQGTEKGITSASSPITHETENKSIISGPSCVADLVNGPIKVEHPISSQGSEIHAYGLEGTTLAKENSGAETTKLGASPPVSIVNSGSALEDSGPISDQFHSITPATALGVYAPVSDPVLVPSHDSQVPGMTGVIKREVGSQRTVVETSINKLASRDLAGSESLAGKLSSEVNSSCTQAKVQGKSQGFEANQLSDASVASPSMTGSTGSRPSSNYSSRSQQQSVSQKVGPTKEWKPKPTQVNPSQPLAIHGAICTSEVTHITKEAVEQSPFPSSSTASEDTALKLQKKLEELHFSDTKHVIIPNHLQVPESERTGLSFGSFDTSFVLGTGFADSPDDEKNSTPLSVSSQEIEENDEEPASSCSIHVASSMAQETDYSDHPPPMQIPEDLSSGEADVVPSGTSAVPEYDQSKLDSALAPEGPQYSVVHTAPTYSTFGMLPQIFGSQFAPFEATDSQSRDASHLPSFVVPQPFDPSTNFYAQVYRPTADGDGRFSPFIPSTPATKLNGNVAVLPAQTGQSPQESGSSLVPSAAGPTPLATQAAGLMQSNLAVNQQAVPVFRQAAAVHMPFPPNYLPYTQYFSPFFVPPPTIHPFINNAAFPQQPPTGSIYPTPAGAGTANPVKYSISQFKPATNTGNPIGIPAGYGTYSSNPTGYTPNPSASTGNSAGNEDTTASQYKENNVYITGQQSEGSAVWMPAPARDIAGLQGNSYYGLPPQGPHMSFAPTQAGHGAFAGMYHPNQTVATNVHSLLQQTQSMAGNVEMVGAPAGVYQQPQRAQVNWANNY